MKKACVIGWPIAHSRSPLIHGYWLRTLGIEGSYEKVPVEPQDVENFLRDLKANGYAGCNVTIPHKEAAYAVMDRVDDIARKLGAVNTVYVRGGKLHGTSTDGEGFLASLLSKFPAMSLRDAKVVILGAGGSARSIIPSLQSAGAGQTVIVNRSLDRAEKLRGDMGPGVEARAWNSLADELRGAALLINTTSLGMHGQPDLDIDLGPLPKTAVVSDIVYVPLETAFLRDARQAGYRTVGGLGMLLHQAVRGFELWFGVRPTVTPELEQLIMQDVMKA
ncbi:MAG: shikimate dehydrogenase [Rhizobiales bacterium]|nr:shikimate dehydrogenase [Hyphomicrobiales bacterium]